MPDIQTREQRQADGVFQLVSRVAARDQAYKQAYGSMAHGLPILIRSAGLVQAVAFVQSRPNSQQPQKDLLTDLAIVLGYPNADSLGTASRKPPLASYMRLTHEALAALLWFKRFAQSVLHVEGSEGEEP
ncbi:type III-B CRISPR module-associated protein Cmr5 [Candidatus Oscillochloris fontis]|uniref:type III-B CRISPR module-associated protein Cmr5 n=1 Tax=Candidatus Oscillochloris fontis TaxID=2496868 RepID=UPI001930F612|nr:type III-B CRISPR module-associated protein Cmr5 [Candidatus Oscillochloris fontis]